MAVVAAHSSCLSEAIPVEAAIEGATAQTQGSCSLTHNSIKSGQGFLWNSTYRPNVHRKTIAERWRQRSIESGQHLLGQIPFVWL
jgi:hypothetical protein